MKITVANLHYHMATAAHLHQPVIVLEIKDNEAAWALLEYYGRQLND